MIVNAGYRGKVGGGVPKFTYTGNYNVRDDGVVELLTSGTIVFLNPATIDLFLVGGGGAGGSAVRGSGGWGGGGGGYTKTFKNVTVPKNTQIAVAVGDGAVTSKSASNVPDGGATTFGDMSAAGGKSAKPNTNNNTNDSSGANGGSGGGGGRYQNYSASGTGGNNGGNGERGTSNGGTGQQNTTREFDEPTGKLYAGGGGGGTYAVDKTPAHIAKGGDGGGGDGAWTTSYAGTSRAPVAGAANTGGGGGGGSKRPFEDSYDGAAGGSGIVCFRIAK